MRILSEQELSIKPVLGVSDNELPKSTLVLAGQLTDQFIRGIVLEAAVLWGEHYLLFMTDDIPFEEALDICLLDKNLNLIDSVTLGVMYSTGFFSSLTLTGPNTLSFRFIGELDWKIELLSQPKFCVPFFSEPRGVWRKFGFTKHFNVYGHLMSKIENG